MKLTNSAILETIYQAHVDSLKKQYSIDFINKGSRDSCKILIELFQLVAESIVDTLQVETIDRVVRKELQDNNYHILVNMLDILNLWD